LSLEFSSAPGDFNKIPTGNYSAESRGGCDLIGTIAWTSLLTQFAQSECFYQIPQNLEKLTKSSYD